MVEVAAAMSVLIFMACCGARMRRRHPWDLWRLRRRCRMQRELSLISWQIGLISGELKVVSEKVQNMRGDRPDLVDEVMVQGGRVLLQPVWVLRRNRSQRVSTWRRL